MGVMSSSYREAPEGLFPMFPIPLFRSTSCSSKDVEWAFGLSIQSVSVSFLESPLRFAEQTQ